MTLGDRFFLKSRKSRRVEQKGREMALERVFKVLESHCHATAAVASEPWL